MRLNLKALNPASLTWKANGEVVFLFFKPDCVVLVETKYNSKFSLPQKNTFQSKSFHSYIYQLQANCEDFKMNPLQL